MESNSRASQEDLLYNYIASHIQQREIGYKYAIVREPMLSEYTTANVPIQWKPDFIILKGRYPYIVVEVTSPRKFEQSTYRNRFLSANFKFDLELIGADYMIITDTVNLIVITNKDDEFPQVKPVEFILSLLDEEITPGDLEQMKSQIVKVFMAAVAESDFPDRQEPRLGQATRRFIRDEGLFENITYNESGRFFHFKSNAEIGLKNFENRFFQTLLDPVTEEAVCRYTTLDTLFHTIHNKSYRMASHIAMNDRGEVDYVDRYIGAFYKPLVGMSLAEVQQLNRNYISSCTTIAKEDDLTMYRLYGDDSRGVCLRFNVTNSTQSGNLIVKKISYAIDRHCHPELDLLKNIVNNLSGTYKLRFRFLYLDIWKHFFKSSDYAVEQEVRVLYVDSLSRHPGFNSDGWVIAQPDRILSKYVTFHLNGAGFPLTLAKIILGPNCPERDINKRQLEVLLAEQGMTNIRVENSEIESYRKS